MRKTGYKIFAAMFLLTCSMLLIFHQSITSAITSQNISSDSVSTMGAGFGGGHDKKGGPGMNGGHWSNGNQGMTGGSPMNGAPGTNDDNGASGGKGMNGDTGVNAGQRANSDQGNSND